MHPIIARSFGGLSRSYYIRQFLFGLVFPVFIFAMVLSRGGMPPLQMAIFCALNSLLYPYARFVYESIVGYVMGNNVFFVNAFLMLLVKLFTIMLCWAFALFIAPMGLIWLYFHHSRNENQAP